MKWRIIRRNAELELSADALAKLREFAPQHCQHLAKNSELLEGSSAPLSALNMFAADLDRTYFADPR